MHFGQVELWHWVVSQCMHMRAPPTVVLLSPHRPHSVEHVCSVVLISSSITDPIHCCDDTPRDTAHGEGRPPLTKLMFKLGEQEGEVVHFGFGHAAALEAAMA